MLCGARRNSDRIDFLPVNDVSYKEKEYLFQQ